MKRILMGLTLVAVLAAFAGVSGAQSLTGTIAGTITDEQGGVLPGVTVTLTGRTGSQTQITDERGEFRFLGLEPGPYNVRAELEGFQPKSESGLQVNIGRTAEIRFTMPVGGLQETVEVTANAVTIDTRTTATDTNLSKDLLFSMPLSQQNPSTTLLDYTPGVNDNSAFGGTESYGNALLLDGVDTRDPAGGSSWAFYGFNMIEEVQVGGLGQPAEYGGFTGAVVNTITKSGGNRFSSLFEYRYTGKDLAGDNTSDAIAQQNPGLATPSRYDKLNDYTVQLGGPLKRDKLFFFGSVQRYSIKEDPDGPRTIRTEVSPRFNGKLTANITPSDTLTFGFQYDQYNQKGRTVMGGAALTTDYRTADQDSPEAIWNVQYRKVIGSSTFLEAKFTGYWGYYYVDPINPEPSHLDGDTGGYSGGGGAVFWADRGRNQVNVALSKYAQKAGSHNFKFGVEIERSRVRDRYSYSDENGKPITYYDLGGEPYLAYEYAYDLQGRNRRESYYAQDQWKVGRVTANLGVRLDNIRGYSPLLDQTVYDTKSLQPRLGVAWDVTGRGTSVLKGFYGQLYEGPQYYTYYQALPGIGDYVGYEVGPGWQVGEELFRVSGESKYRVGDDLKHPRVDEFNVAYEQQFLRNYKITATYIRRDSKNIIDSVFPAARWNPIPYTNPVTNQQTTLYEWANDEIDQQFEIRNIDGFQYLSPSGEVLGTIDAFRQYNGMMLVLQRALRNRWQAQVSYVYSRTKGTINNDSSDGLGGTNFQHPVTALVNREGYASNDRTHEVKAFAGYQIPVIEVGLNGFLSVISGYPYAPYARLSAGTIGWTGAKNVLLQSRGTHRTDTITKFDLRAEKVFSFAPYRFGIYMDAQNLFNQGTVSGVQTRFPSAEIVGTTVPFGGPTAVQSGRQITFGGRFNF
ncbi:MAG TPA: TonB-dependent receptor [Vicinamibacterales bacterium]|nr:TonB-dependent receptor [Vicinamibacterales bacterium]